MSKEMQQKILEWFEAEAPTTAVHYSEVARKLDIPEQPCNTNMNALFRQGVLRKPQAGRFLLPLTSLDLNDDPEDSQEPWDTTGVSADQVLYFGNLLESLNKRFIELDTTVARAVLRKMNEARRIAGIPFKEYE